MKDGTINRVFRSSFPETERSNFRTIAWELGVPEADEELRPYHGTVLHALAVAAKMEDDVGITLLSERPSEEPTHKSFREIYHAACNMSVALRKRGVREGDRVLLILPTSFDFIISFFAVQLAGAIAVPAYPPAGLRVRAGIDRLAHIANHAQTSLCLTNKQIKQVLGELPLRTPIDDLTTVDELDTSEEPPTKYKAYSGDYSFIQYTSGSTGKPKGVLLSHSNLVSNIHCSGQAMKIGRHDVMVSWCPLYHDMGLIGGLLYPIYWRIPLVLMSPLAFLKRPARWLRAISDHKGTISPAPNFAYSMCVARISDKDREGLDLSSWRLALNGAEPVNYRTVVDFQQTYEPLGFPKSGFLPVYGLAEGTLAAAFPKPEDPVRYEVVDRQELANGRAVLSSGRGSMAIVSCGSHMPGHDVVIVDEDGSALPEREVGHVVIAGPSVMEGYYNDSEATERVVQGGWLWTGDLGYFADQQLYITGRAKDLIIVRGRNIYAEDIERVAERVDGLRPSGVVAFGVYDDAEGRDLIVLVAETKIQDAEKRAALAAELSENVTEFCDIRLDEVVMVAPGTIPKTSSGKRQRSQTRDQYLAGELKAAKLGKLQLGMVFARSKAGMVVMKARKLFKRRPSEEAQVESRTTESTEGDHPQD